MKTDKLLPLFLILPTLIIYGMLVFYPLISEFYFSLNKIFYDLNPKFVGLNNYIQLFNDPLFHKSIVNSLIYTAGSVAGQFLLGFLMALLLNLKLKGTTHFRLIFLITFYLSTLIAAYAWFIMYSRVPPGIFNGMLSLFGIPPIDWLSDLNVVMYSMILANVWYGASYSMLFIEVGLMSIPEDLYEAARIDGASMWNRFRHITLPLVKPFLLSNLTLITMMTFNFFIVIYIMTNGGPLYATEVLALYMWHQGFSWGHLGLGAAIAMILLLFNLTFLVFYKIVLRRILK
ncbi:MAG: carbohydrate ABC transporter permease [Candidatus Baldrarchaeia archaeon]